MKDTQLLDEQPIAWTPTPDVIEKAQLTKFMKQVGVSNWEDLYAFSINDVEKFTEEVLKFLDIKFDPPYQKLLDTSDGIEMPNWFVSSPSRDDAQASDSTFTINHSPLNITTICLDRWQTDDMKDQPAIIWEGEEVDFPYNTISYEKLFYEVDCVANGLRRDGFSKGDAIGIHLPMIPETVVSLLAIARIGAISVPVFSGYGVDAIASRLNAVGAKGLITCDKFPRRGKNFDSLDIAKEALALCPTVEHSYIVNRHAIDDLDLTGFDDRFVSFYVLSGCDPIPIDVEPTAAEDPLIILYTSGTTGKPKGIAHTHASFPIKAAQDMAFGTDVGKGTRICWYTDIGWMMGPWLIYGALINGATICLYDGAPDYPTPDRMWEFCAKHKVEVLGISPTLIRSLAAAEERRSSDTQNSPPYEGGVEPASGDGVVLSSSRHTTEEITKKPFELHDLSSLRAFASTGEPWNPAPWWWLFKNVGNSKLPIINYSGGTEISGGILMGNPLLPIKPCSFPAPCLGMDVDILDEQGNSVQNGQVGELVIKQPWIGMARGFWQEKDRYLETYWRRFKDTWVHGDFAMRDKDGHWFILGRSDDTLKVAGKRVGPAEVESLLVAHPQITEAAVIGIPDETKGTAMVAFVVRNADRDAPSVEELKALVAKDMGKPLAPSKIHFVSSLPKTRNAKVMRRVIRSAYLGEDPGDLSSLENPNAIDEIHKVNK